MKALSSSIYGIGRYDGKARLAVSSDQATSNFGLSPQTLVKLSSVWIRHANVDKVWIYGSRAKGGFREGSDIDLSLVGEGLTTTELLQIENELEELMLLYKVDLSLLAQLDNAELADHIRRRGLVLFERTAQSSSPK